MIKWENQNIYSFIDTQLLNKRLNYLVHFTGLLRLNLTYYDDMSSPLFSLTVIILTSAIYYFQIALEVAYEL